MIRSVDSKKQLRPIDVTINVQIPVRKWASQKTCATVDPNACERRLLILKIIGFQPGILRIIWAGETFPVAQDGTFTLTRQPEDLMATGIESVMGRMEGRNIILVRYVNHAIGVNDDGVYEETQEIFDGLRIGVGPQPIVINLDTMTPWPECTFFKTSELEERTLSQPKLALAISGL